MAKLYARRIGEGTLTIEQVPAHWRKAVETLLGKMEREGREA